jgi:triosephosphate isomerase
MSRTPFVAGNWKMNKTRWDARDLAREIVEGVRGIDDVDVAIAPTAVCLSEVSNVVHGTSVRLSAQNMHWAESGAYTGEISPLMLQDVGCSLVILGHSERRAYFSETDELVNQKVKSALAHDLDVIVCVGESLDEREGGKTQQKVDFQIRAALSDVRRDDIPRITIAYEPIWAIGTGRTASPQQAQEVHAQIRSLVAALYDRDTADAVRIQYGGSVKPHNIADLIAQPDIDGALVGGASLKADSFVAIIEACSAG